MNGTPFDADYAELEHSEYDGTLGWVRERVHSHWKALQVDVRDDVAVPVHSE